MEIKILREPITLAEVAALAKDQFGEMINVRPSQGNRSRDVSDPDVRERVLSVVRELVRP